ncbi:MAG: ABC transporter ATP-binding protein [Anaeroplasma sp.]
MIKEKKYTIILSCILILDTIFLLSIPILCSNLVNKAIESIDNSNINLIYDALLLLIPGISMVFLKILYNYLYSAFSLKLEKKYKEILYKELLSKRLAELKKIHVGKIELLYNQDVVNIIKNKLNTIPQMIKEVSRVLLAILILAFIDYKYLILIILLGFIGFIFSKIYSSISRKLHKEVLEKEGKLNSFIIETNSQLKLIQAYDSNEYINNYFLNINSEVIKIKKKRNNFVYGANSGLYAFITFLYLFTICYGALSISKGLSYGNVLALIQLLSNIQNPFLSFSSLINNYNLAKASDTRLKNVLDLPNCDNTLKIDDFDSIVFENVSFSYDNEKQIINDLSFEINKNDIVLLSGPSGIGKTTVLMLLMGFLEPTSGRIYLKNNNKIINIDLKTRGLFGYVPQENIIFSGSIIDNIYVLTGKGREDAIRALKLANVYDEIMTLPSGLDTILGERGSGLSLGQIQRILIAIAILKDSKILLLDEFSSALDSDNEDIIINNLKELNKTIVYITHRNKTIDNKKVITLKE